MTGKSLDKSIYVKTYAKVDLMQGLVDRWAKILDKVYTANFENIWGKSTNPSDEEVDFYIAINE
ncbi:MAG: DeoR family transcriptional regulator [Bacteroidota bacterium]